MGKRSSFERRDNDFYPTPAAAVGPLVPHLRRERIRTFAEPCCGDGALIRHLESYGLVCRYRGDRATGQDALEIESFSDPVITNPPWKRIDMHQYAMAARCYLQRKGFGWVGDREREIAETDRLARRALELGRDDAVALCTAGLALVLIVRDLDDGAALIDKGLALNPNLAWAWQFSALARAWLGEPETAIEHAARAMRLSPQDPQMYAMQIAVAFGHFVSGRYDEAFSWAQSALREQPNFFVGTCVAAASGALAGRLPEAEKAMVHLRRLDPGLRISNLKDLLPFRRQEFDRWADGLRRAGLPE